MFLLSRHAYFENISECPLLAENLLAGATPLIEKLTFTLGEYPLRFLKDCHVSKL